MSYNHYLSYDVGSVSDISTCNKIDNHFWLTGLWVRLCSDALNVTHMAKPYSFHKKNMVSLMFLHDDTLY